MDALAVRRKLISTCFLAGLGEDILGLLGLLQKLRVTLCRLGVFLYRSCCLGDRCAMVMIWLYRWANWG